MGGRRRQRRASGRSAPGASLGGMTVFVALLRAVNVGGTGRLAMADLAAACAAASFTGVRTLLASGNAVFRTDSDEAAARTALEAALFARIGRSVDAVLRDAAGIGRVLADNPFPDAPPDRVMAILMDAAPPADALDGVTGQAPDEAVRLGQREIYVHYGSGMGRTRLRIPAAQAGTARNMNTIARLAAMAAE